MDCVWTIFLLLLVFGLSMLWYSRKSKCYLEDVGIPFAPVSVLLILKFLFRLVFRYEINMHEREIEKYKTYGRIYGTTERGDPTISIADPELLRKILVKDFHIFFGRRPAFGGDPISDNMLFVLNGEKWKRIRTIITPAFSTGKIKRMIEIILSSAKTLVKNLSSKPGQPIDGNKYLKSFTMDVIASTAFGTKIYSHEDPNNRFVQEANKSFSGQFNWRFIFIVLCPKIARFLGINFFDKKMIKFFKDATLKIIEDRKKTGTVKNDFLQLLIEAEKEHELEENSGSQNTKSNMEDITPEEMDHDEENAKIFMPMKKYKSLDQNELLAQCLTFFIAGFDTTATTLTCLLYSLAVNPNIQDKLRDEVDAAISKYNNQLTYETIQEMKYLDKIISETLRMYPPLFRIERLADSDYKLEGTNITIRKGTSVAVPVCAIHQDPEFYPEPEIFNPERFNFEGKNSRHPYSYLTFGAGPRNCVGMRFALLEIKLCVAYIVSQLIIKKCPETESSFKLSSPLGLLKPQATFAVEKRTNKVLQTYSPNFNF